MLLIDICSYEEYDIPVIILFHKQDIAPPILKFTNKSEGSQINLTLDQIVLYYQKQNAKDIYL